MYIALPLKTPQVTRIASDAQDHQRRQQCLIPNTKGNNDGSLGCLFPQGWWTDEKAREVNNHSMSDTGYVPTDKDNSVKHSFLVAT